MPASHQRHRRSPFKRTSFRRTSSGSSSLRSVSEIQSRFDDHVKPQFSHPTMPECENGDVVIRNVDVEKQSVAFHPGVTVTVCRDEMAVVRKGDGEISQAQLQSQSQIRRCENIKGEIEGRDTSPVASSVYSTNTLGYPTTDPDEDADNGSCSYTSYSSIPQVPELSLETLTSRSTVSFSDISSLNVEGKNDCKLGVSMASSRMERWKTFGKVKGKVRGFLRGGKAGDGEADGEGEGEGKEKHGKHEKKIRPFLRKYCLHPFSMRSSFRLVGWIEDPVGYCVGHGAGYGAGYASGYGEVRTGYAYGGGIGDARLWDEARRSGLEGGLY
ncbi:hypothetical protein BOTCAL_0144g00130 [Botryotinia calthae]|uniref:Uncharacterized protein n=1 Tax=Botryotinia calthae TaxID=38488 RepID=A0A4Y8D2U1_9HELO|nr:hypothetical protein BOTCAL_0144g00130 [Botryotinia calthae]